MVQLSLTRFAGFVLSGRLSPGFVRLHTPQASVRPSRAAPFPWRMRSTVNFNPGAISLRRGAFDIRILKLRRLMFQRDDSRHFFHHLSLLLDLFQVICSLQAHPKLRCASKEARNLQTHQRRERSTLRKNVVQYLAGNARAFAAAVMLRRRSGRISSLMISPG